MSSAALRDGILDVPVIDITCFRMPYADAAARSEIVRQVDEAARTVGFMQVTGHGIPATTLSEFTSATDAFFALDAQAKARYRCPPGINRGYTPPKAESLANSLGLASAADLFEAINVGTSAADFPGLDLPADVYAANVYPADEVPGFEAAVTAWFAAAGRVARTMVRIFGVALGGREDYFAPFTDHSIDVLRMNNYRLPAPDAQARERPARHGRPHRLRHRDRALGRPGARPGDSRGRRELAPGHACRGRAARQPGRRDGPLDERGVDLHPAPGRRAADRRDPRPQAVRRLLPRRQRGRGDRVPAQLRLGGQPGQVRAGHGRRAPGRQAGRLARRPAQSPRDP